MKAKVYLETTIPSYITSRPSRDIVIAGKQETVREWWVERRKLFEYELPVICTPDELMGGEDE